MDLSRKAKKNLKKNLQLSLSLCIACMVFLLVGLSSMTWALFSSEYSSTGNKISTASFNLSLSLNKLDKAPLTSNANTENINEESEELFHSVQINENGDYEISINVDGTTSGYCTINFNSDDELLMSKNIKVNLEDESIKFNVHTNRDLDIEITNINWGNLESYNELEDDYYFGTYNLVYRSGIGTKLPESYIELSYIESDGSQYTDDIVNDGEAVFTFVERTDEESGETTYKAIKFVEDVVKNENYEVLVHLVPCYSINDNVEGIYDLLNDKFYPNKSDTPFNKGEELFNYSYDGLDFLNIEGNLPNSKTYNYGVLNEDVISNCELALSGFHFIGFRCAENFVDENTTVESLLREYEPRDGESIILEAIYERNKYYLLLDDNDNPIEVTCYETVNDIVIPCKDGFKFLGYLDGNGNKVFDENGKFIGNEWTALLGNKQKISLHSDWLSLDTNGGIDNE